MGNTIKINDRFSFEKKPDCWHLYRKGKGKDPKTTYYTKLQHLCSEVIEDKLGKCKTIEEIRCFLEELSWVMKKDGDVLCNSVAKCLEKLS